MEKYLYSYPLIGGRMFCSFSFKESDRRQGNCGTHKSCSALTPADLFAEAGQRSTSVGTKSAHTCVRPMGTTALTCSQAHLAASRLAGGWIWRPSIQPRQGKGGMSRSWCRAPCWKISSPGKGDVTRACSHRTMLN